MYRFPFFPETAWVPPRRWLPLLWTAHNRVGYSPRVVVGALIATIVVPVVYFHAWRLVESGIEMLDSRGHLVELVKSPPMTIVAIVGAALANMLAIELLLYRDVRRELRLVLQQSGITLCSSCGYRLLEHGPRHLVCPECGREQGD